MLAYDPGYFLTQYEIPHIRSPKPVDFMNFIDYFKISSYDCEKPFLCYHGEVLTEHNDLLSKNPITFLSAAIYKKPYLSSQFFIQNI